MFQTQSACLMEVARTLGAGRWMLARHVALPLARPALAIGLSLALLETLNDIGASEYLGVRTLTLTIFTTWLNRGSLPAAAQIACVMLLVVAGLIALERYGRRNRRFSISVRQPRFVIPIDLAGWRGWLALAACAMPVALGFVIPAGFLVREVIVRGLLVGFDADLIRHTMTTVVLAGSATAIALGARPRRGDRGAIGAAAARRGLPPGRRPRLRRARNGACPRAAVAAGRDRRRHQLGRPHVRRRRCRPARGRIRRRGGDRLCDTLPVDRDRIDAGRPRPHRDEIDDVARTLGAGTGGAGPVDPSPLLRPALGGAALLVFVDCLKELPATLLLRPLNVETLSTYIYQFATRGNFEEGALASLLIVAVGILPVIRIVRYADFMPAHGTARRRGRPRRLNRHHRP